MSDLIRIGGVDFEFDGAIDVVLASTEDDWEVIDLKIAFGDLHPETRERYQLQTASYAHLLQQYVSGEVDSCITVFGSERTTITSDSSQDDLPECLQRLIQNC